MRVTLDTVISAFVDGATAEGIAYQYPSLDLADVYAVIAYYLRRQTEVDAYLRQRQRQAESIREQNEARFDPSGIRARLLARRHEPVTMLRLAAVPAPTLESRAMGGKSA